MLNYCKLDMYLDVDWEMVQGYMVGKDGQCVEWLMVVYMYGYCNGVLDRIGVFYECVEVFCCCVEMIFGIIFYKVWFQGRVFCD